MYSSESVPSISFMELGRLSQTGSLSEILNSSGLNLLPHLSHTSLCVPGSKTSLPAQLLHLAIIYFFIPFVLYQRLIKHSGFINSQLYFFHNNPPSLIYALKFLISHSIKSSINFRSSIPVSFHVCQTAGKLHQNNRLVWLPFSEK